MEACWVPGSEEGEEDNVSWEGDGLGVLDAEGVLMVNYIVKGQTVAGTYNTNLLRQFREEIK